LHAIQSTGLALFSTILTDPLEKLGQIIIPPFTTISTLFNSAGLGEFFRLGDIPISEKLNTAISIIKNIEHNTKILPIEDSNDHTDAEFSLQLQNHVNTMIELSEELKRAKTSIVKMTQSGNRLYILPILNNVLTLYHYKENTINPAFTNLYNELITILKDDI